MQMDLLLDPVFNMGGLKQRRGQGREESRWRNRLVEEKCRWQLGEGVRKISGEKSRKTSQECKCVLRCKCLSALKAGEWKRIRHKDIFSPQRQLPKDRGMRRLHHLCDYFYPTILHSANPTPHCDILRNLETFQEGIQSAFAFFFFNINMFCPIEDQPAFFGIISVYTSFLNRSMDSSSFSISQFERGERAREWERKNAPIYADRSICVK